MCQSIIYQLKLYKMCQSPCGIITQPLLYKHVQDVTAGIQRQNVDGHFLPLPQDLKLKYYRLMIELCQHDNSYLAVCQHYRSIFDTPRIQQEEETLKNVRNFTVTYRTQSRERVITGKRAPTSNIWLMMFGTGSKFTQIHTHHYVVV